MSVFRKHKASADRSASDRRRHRHKIEKAIKDGVYDIVSNESIIGQDGKKRIRIPVKGIKEHQFVYGENNKRVGSSAGKELKRGQVIGKKEHEKGGKPKASNESGEDFYEVEITLEELAGYLFDDLELPDLEKKKLRSVKSEKPQRRGYRTKGIRPRLDKKRTLRNKLRRKAIASRTRSEVQNEDSEEESFSFTERDLIYRHFADKPKENTSAVIFFIMDTSGSMSKNKKFLARSYFFLIYQFLRYRYDDIEIVFISHNVDAKEVNEEQFFKKGSSGGTIISPALDLAYETIEKRYHPANWNIYSFYCSDGDNWPSDVPKSIESARRLANVSQLFSYCEIIPDDERWGSSSEKTQVMKAFTSLKGKNFKIAEIGHKLDIWPAFKRLFGGRVNE